MKDLQPLSTRRVATLATIAKQAPQHDFWVDAETRFVQPYQAIKTYLCPGCNRDIPPRTFHIVAVPAQAADLRRHWHKGCWNGRASRGPRSR